MEVNSANNVPLSTLIYSLKQNIEKSTLETPILSGKIDKYTHYVYAYLGKLSKSKIRLAALSYSLKMSNLMNSQKKLSILSSGGVFKNKKLQKGSTLSLTNNSYTNNKDVSEFKEIHIFSIFMKNSEEVSNGNFLTNFKSKLKNPFIECE